MFTRYCSKPRPPRARPDIPRCTPYPGTSRGAASQATRTTGGRGNLTDASGAGGGSRSDEARVRRPGSPASFEADCAPTGRFPVDAVETRNVFAIAFAGFEVSSGRVSRRLGTIAATQPNPSAALCALACRSARRRRIPSFRAMTSTHLQEGNLVPAECQSSNGSERLRGPPAATIAFASAGASATIGVSPAPADGISGRSSRITSIGGTSVNRGTV